jgi:hypothetical protein
LNQRQIVAKRKRIQSDGKQRKKVRIVGRRENNNQERHSLGNCASHVAVVPGTWIVGGSVAANAIYKEVKSTNESTTDWEM